MPETEITDPMIEAGAKEMKECSPRMSRSLRLEMAGRIFTAMKAKESNQVEVPPPRRLVFYEGENDNLDVVSQQFLEGQWVGSATLSFEPSEPHDA